MVTAGEYRYFGHEELEMPGLPRALVISNFPIIARTATQVLGRRYDLATRTWAEFVDAPDQQAEVVIVDVTTIDARTALSVLARVLPGVQVVVCSLHHNEVQVYRHTPTGLRIERALPSLLFLSA